MYQNIRKASLPSHAWWLGYLTVLFGMVGCATREQGCLDIYASNFDLSAEKSCDGCCLYPAVNISLSQRWLDSNFTTTDTLLDIMDQQYQITDIKYFLSSWLLHGTDDEVHTVDSAVLNCDPPRLYSPDVVMVDAKQFNYQLGIVRTAPSIDSVSFVLGLTEAYSCIQNDTSGRFTKLTVASPLWDPSRSKLTAMRLIVLDLQTAVLDTVWIDLVKMETVSFPYAFTIGSNTTLGLTVNYAQWFANVDITQPNTFESSVASGFNGSIYQTPE